MQADLNLRCAHMFEGTFPDVVAQQLFSYKITIHLCDGYFSTVPCELLYLFDFYFNLVCLFVLRFYGPVNPMGSCRARSVYLTTRLLDRLSPLSG